MAAVFASLPSTMAWTWAEAKGLLDLYLVETLRF